MTDIQDLSKKLREAREKATPEISVGHPKMKFWPDSIIGVDCCDEEPFVLTEMNRNMDRWKEDRDFFVLAANHITEILNELDRLIEVEEVMREALKHDVDKIEAQYSMERDQLLADAREMQRVLQHISELHESLSAREFKFETLSNAKKSFQDFTKKYGEE